MEDNEICCMSAVQMADAVRLKKLSPLEIFDSVSARIERLNPSVNAYCTLVTDSAREEARRAEADVMRGERLGRLHGVPVSIKDLIFTRGIRTTGGSKIYEEFVPEQDDIVVERLKAAGAIIIGKTNTPEFGWMGLTSNRVFGATRNPWNVNYHAGGSSGGAAAAVALGMGPLAIGTDGGGSIRIPSSFCGVFGFKPSFGRVPQYHEFPGWELLSHTGPIARTVQDSALTMEIIAGRDDRDCSSLPETELSYTPFLDAGLEGLRIGWSRDLGYATVDAEVLRIAEAAVGGFEDMGCFLEEVKPQARNPEGSFSTVVRISLAAVLQDKLREWRGQMDPHLVRFIESGQDREGTEYVMARQEQRAFWDSIRPLFEKYDLLLTPTVAVPPLSIDRFVVRQIAGVDVTPLGWMAFTYPFNITGQPAASIPCGLTNEGLPVGLQIVGRRFDDATVLRAAAAFERAKPWRFPDASIQA